VRSEGKRYRHAHGSVNVPFPSVVVDAANDGGPFRLVGSPPAPRAGDIHDDASMIDRSAQTARRVTWSAGILPATGEAGILMSASGGGLALGPATSRRRHRHRQILMEAGGGFLFILCSERRDVSVFKAVSVLPGR
jgi:hypothetical protein